MIENLTVSKIIWICVAIIAMTSHATILFYCMGDKAIAYTRSKDPAVLYTAKEAVVQQLIRTLAQVCFFLAGALAGTIPSAGYILDDDRLIILGTLTQGLIVMGQILLMFASIKLHFERHRLLALIGGRRISDEVSTVV